jgi:hypothetical protein
MIDIATILKERFDLAAIWFLERNDVMHGVEADLPEEDAKAVELLDNLRDSVDAIPPSLIDGTDRLRIANPELFERTLVRGVQVVGFGFYPATATEFVEVLNRTVEQDAACT